MPDIFECYLSLPDEIYLHLSHRPNELSKNAKGHGERIEITEDGILVLENGFWRKGYPHHLHVVAVDQVKRLIMIALRVVKDAPLLALLFFPFRKILLEAFINFSEMTLFRYYFKPEYYLKTGKIIGKAITETFKDERLGRIAMMIWEYDDRYRYCFQTIFGLFNRQDFNKNPRKELKRLCDELIEREIGESKEVLIKKWKALKVAISLLPMKNVIKCLSRIDMEAMKLDKDDLHFAAQIKEFRYE